MSCATESNRVDENSSSNLLEQGSVKDTNDAAIPTAEKKNSKCTCSSILRILDVYQFPIAILVAILVARAYPDGAKVLEPDITMGWIAVIVIFFASGLCLRWEELSKAVRRLYFNSFVQIFNFAFVSVATYGFSRLMVEVGAINQALGDGLAVCGCLPMSINVIIILTASAGGDEAAAVFNTTIGNTLGIFISPALILFYVGASADISLGDVFQKLTVRVIVPMVAGLAVRMSSNKVSGLVTAHKHKLKMVQEYSLVFIIYGIFCDTFGQGTSADPLELVVLVLCVLFLLVVFMTIAWVAAGQLSFASDPRVRVVALYGCTAKTIALGIPMINSIYEHDPNEGLYALPLLAWYLSHLLIGSVLTSTLAKLIDEVEEATCTPSADPVSVDETEQSVKGPELATDDIEAPQELTA